MAAAVSAIRRTGIPLDTEKFSLLLERRDDIRSDLIADVDRHFHVYEDGSFVFKKFGEYLVAQGIPWPLTKTGRLCTDEETFEELVPCYPQLMPLYVLRNTLTELKDISLQIGHDGRNRAMLAPFRSVTGRNQPANIFGLSVWFRNFIQPLPGYAIAYIDWDQQEPGIAAALSGDPAMMAAYRTGNIYLGFAKQIGALPQDATKKAYPDLYERYKQVCLGMNYGMGAFSLALRIHQPEVIARGLIQKHHDLYKEFWKWSDQNLRTMYGRGSLSTYFGWRVHMGPRVRPTFLRNFPMQAHGSDMMRIAAILGVERGIEICAPVHDAFLIHAPVDRIDADVATMQAAMAEASRIVLNGFELTSSSKIWRYPERYQDDRGQAMWDKVMGLLDQCQKKLRVA
jgi:hypothetical protein